MEVSTVMAPTATSPPYRARLLVKLTDRMLSVDTITKGEIPNARQGRMISRRSFILDTFSFRMVLFPVRNLRIHTALTAWLSTVASAAPATPISSRKMNTGSSTILITAPMTVVSMENWAKPWVEMKLFIPMTISTNTLPRI